MVYAHFATTLVVDWRRIDLGCFLRNRFTPDDRLFNLEYADDFVLVSEDLDLIDPGSQQMMIQTEDGQANNMLLYSSAMEGQHHQMDEAVIVGQEEEKENHQYSLS
ncbi:unnamed protein product [Echinostoma caproni]|uniref:Reverse transcriptase domain-containing protein n=1 Tax=Echinostoma caproni TaxID=27848 RepID=A0A183AY35_9TREM|nr:unnamed protein product [Echinostoma caproni]